MNGQTQQNRITPMRVNKFVAVYFLAEMKMWRQRVLEEMDDEIAGQNEECTIPAPQFETGGNHFQQSGRQHESGTERDEIFQIPPLPMPLDNDSAAKYVRHRRGQAKQQTGCNRMHADWQA